MKKQHQEAIQVFQQRGGLMRSNQASEAGIRRNTLAKLQADGLLIKEARGLYRLASSPPISQMELITVAARVPAAVICLISALEFHELTTQIPAQVYVALPKSMKKPRLDYPPLEVVWLSEAPYRAGVEEHTRGGVTLRVYNAAKTVTDCFKFRNKIGEDVALEALKEYLRKPQANVDELINFARINRVANVMRPYIQAAL